MSSSPRALRRIRPLRTALLAAALTAACSPVMAQTADAATVARPGFDIPAQVLDQALDVYTRQSGIRVVRAPEATAGLQSAAVSGAPDAEAALRLLLRGTGLVAMPAGDGAVMLQAAASDDGVVTTGTLNIAGNVSGADHVVDPFEAYREADSSVTVRRDTIERFRGTSTADIVKGIAGVTAGDPRSANALDLNIRGLQGQSRVPVIVDGGQSTMDAYRGYAGQSQRNYLDPDLISSLRVEKGPSLAPNASGAIGGAVMVETLGVDDILAPGEQSGVRIRAGISNGSARDLPAYDETPRTDRNGIGGQSFSIASGFRSERFDAVAALAWRDTGNYFSGHRGYGDYPQGRRLLASLNPPRTEVTNTSSESESVLLKGVWRIDDAQTLEAGFRRYHGEAGEIMASQVVRVDRERIPQWDPGRVTMDAWNLRYRFNPDSDLVDLKANVAWTESDSLMYNGLTGITPWFYDRRTEWYDAPAFDTDPGYKEAYRNELSQHRLTADIGNRSQWFPGDGLLQLDYGLSFSNEDVAPGPNSPAKHDDLVNNRFLRNAERSESSAVVSLTWAPDEHWEFMLGGRYNTSHVRDRNRLATVAEEGVIGQYRYTQLLSGDPDQPSWLADRIAMLNWYPDADGNFTRESLLASPYGHGTVADLSGWNFYDADAPEDLVVPVKWTWSDPIRRTDSAFMPSGSVTYRFNDDSLVYLRYAEGVKQPSLFETTLGLFTAAKPTAELRPERAHSLEAGVSLTRQDLFADGDRAGLKLAWFDTRVDDLITRDYRSFSAGLIRNVDEFKVSGMELQAAYDRGNVFADLSATYYFDAQTCAPDIAAERRQYGVDYGLDDLAGTPDCVDGGFEGSYSNTQNPPRFTANLTLGTRLFDERLTLGMRAIHNDGPISELDDAWNEGLSAIQQLYQPSTVYDLFASWKIDRRWALDVNVDNLLDEYYLDPLALGVMPAPGRVARMAVTMRF